MTHGHGIESGEHPWPARLATWLNATFPHEQHAFINAAVPATGSDYFSLCYKLHVKEDADLYVTEFAINDFNS